MQESIVLAETFEKHWDQLKGITNNVSVLFHLVTSESSVENGPKNHFPVGKMP